MSVQLCVLKDKGETTLELMAPDYGAERVWLWEEQDGANRLDLSREQMRQLRNALNRALGRLEMEP